MCKPVSKTADHVRLAVTVGALAVITYAAYLALVAVGPFVALAAWLAGTGAALSVAYVAREVIRERARSTARARYAALPAARARMSPAEPLTGRVLSRTGGSLGARSDALRAGRGLPGREPAARDRRAIR